jgi:predicted ester cyclase
MSVENHHVIRRLMRTPPERFAEVYHPNFVNHPMLQMNGIDGMKDLAQRYSLAFSDLETSIVAQFPAGEKDDLVVTVFKLRGTHTGPHDTAFGRLPPSNKSVEFILSTVARFSEGRIVERWGFV